MNDLESIYLNADFDDRPRWVYKHQGMQIEFRPIPKPIRLQGKRGISTIGISTISNWQINSAQQLKKTILNKANRYGELDLPYIVAVNNLDFFHELHVEESLFGDEEYLIENYYQPPKLGRKLNGVWTSYGKPRYTRVSAILVCKQLSPYNLAKADVRLYHHFAPKKPYTSNLTKLPHALIENDELIYRDGKHLSEIFGLLDSWPEDEPEE